MSEPSTPEKEGPPLGFALLILIVSLVFAWPLISMALCQLTGICLSPSAHIGEIVFSHPIPGKSSVLGALGTFWGLCLVVDAISASKP